MATKYAALKGKIPKQDKPPTEKETKIAELQKAYEDRSLLNLTAEYNRLNKIADDAADEATKANIALEAVDLLIQEQLDAEGVDSVKISGYTWSGKCEPYPSAEDPSAIIQYFNDNGMADQLTLRAGELATRLKSYVKEEALANELLIEQKTIIDQVTGEERTVTEVRSKIPGVKVFLKTSLSRVKSTK